MTTTFKPVYAAAAGVNIGLDGLANNAARQSDVVDNSTNLYLDALVGLELYISTGSLGTNPGFAVYAYSAMDSTPDYTDGCTGSSAAFTMPTIPNLKFLGFANYTGTVNSGTHVFAGTFSVARAFGGILPKKWGIVAVNQTGCTMNGTATQDTVNKLNYTGVQVQAV